MRRPEHTSQCPICGTTISGLDDLSHAEAWAAHRCPPRTISSIDGAHRRDPESEAVRDYRTEGMRLAEGARMRAQSGDDDPRAG